MKVLLMILGMVSFTVAANLLLKTGASSVPLGGPVSQLVNWRVFLGLCCFGLGTCFYILVLQRLPLNVAQSFAAIQFVGVILASAWVLAEPIGPGQWVGIIFIAMGISIVGWTQR